MTGAASWWLDEDASNIYELKIIVAAGGAPAFVSHVRTPNSHVTRSSDHIRLFYDELDAGAPGGDISAGTQVVSIRTEVVNKKIQVKFTAVVSAVSGPDGKWLLLGRYANAWPTAFLEGATEPTTIKPYPAPAVPVKQVSTTGSNYLRWLPDKSGFTYAVTNQIYGLGWAEEFAYTTVADLKPSIETITLTAPRDIPKGQIAIRHARIITMKGDKVIEKADPVVENNRIVAVGVAGKVAIPREAKIINATGKTVMPGIVEIHAHLRTPGDVFPDKVWPYAANLAYGVTNTRDTSIDSNRVFAYSEIEETREVLGPGMRTFASQGEFDHFCKQVAKRAPAIYRAGGQVAFG